MKTATALTNRTEKRIKQKTANTLEVPADKTGSSRSTNQKFLAMLEQAKCTYDYQDETKDYKNKCEKLKALQKLIELAQSPKHFAHYYVANLDQVMEMIEINIFRPLPNLKQKEADQADGIAQEDELDPSWPFLEPVYQIFFQIALSSDIDPQILKKYVSPQFMQKFLDLFDSQLPSERDYLKNIFHKLYSKLVQRRKMMRKSMDQMFQILIHEAHKFNGASEILDILASIVSGYAIPIRQEHINFFHNIILPLHKVQTNAQFFEQLMRCTMLFLTKDRSLAVPLIETLLKYWPFAVTEKELLFLAELLEAIEVAEPAAIEHLIPKLFKRIMKCIAGDNMHVCDRAMCYFENNYFINIVKIYKKDTYPILVPKITEMADGNHWQKLLHESLQALRSILKELDPEAFKMALNSGEKKYQLQQSNEDRQTLDKKWQILENKITKSNPDFVSPQLPYAPGIVPKDFNEVYSKVYDKVKLNSE